MERKRFSVLFFIKRSKLLKNGEAPVRVSVTYDSLYVELQLKRSVKIPLWSQEKEKSTGKDRNSVELNHYIDALRVKFYQIYQDLELEGKIISVRAIVNRYQGKDETFKTLYNVFKEHNDNCRKLIGTDYADITVRRYDNCLKHLMELVKRDYKVDDMLLREVNGELVRKFDLYLKTEKHFAQNTVIRYMKCFKKVINLAIANEWLTKNPFAGIRFHEVEVNKQFLSQAEINRIWQKEFKIERLELVRDVFIFCVYTGLAFIDVYNLRPEHVSEDSNGNLWIVKPREKTNNICNIPLLSIPKQILEKYKDNPYCMTRNPLIFGLFTRMYLVERVASGIPRMQEAMRKANLPEPEFHTEGIFTAVFKRQTTNSANHDTVNDMVNDTINENEQAILDLLSTSSGLNASEISKHINKSLRTTMRYIKTLQDKDLIEFKGTPKTGGYYLKSNKINP